MKVFEIGSCKTVVSDEQFDFLQARGRVVAAYCEEKGWDKNNLTIQQILEIRSQEAWKNPQASEV